MPTDPLPNGLPKLARIAILLSIFGLGLWGWWHKELISDRVLRKAPALRELVTSTHIAPSIVAEPPASAQFAAEPPASLTGAPKSELEAMYSKAFNEFGANNFWKALKQLDEIDSRHPNITESHNLRGVILMRQSIYDKAEIALQEAVKIDPKFWNAQFNLADIPFLKKDWSEARDRFQKLLSNNVSDQNGEAAQLIQYKIFLTNLLEGKQDAVNSTLIGLALTPGIFQFYANTAVAFHRNERDEASRWLAAANRTFPPRLNRLFGESLYEVGWLARPAFQPVDVAWFLQNAPIFRKRGDMTTALACLHAAIEREPNNPKVVEELAKTYDELQFFDLAKELRQNLQERSASAASATPAAAPTLASAVTPSPTATATPGRLIFSIAQIKVDEKPDPNAEKKLTLRIAVKKEAKTVIDAKKVRIVTFFYDSLDDKDIKVTDAEVRYEWLTPYHDWSTNEQPEILSIDYLRPKKQASIREKNSKSNLPVETGKRRYLGYTVRVYYGDVLQAEEGSPAKLLKLFPFSPPVIDDINPAFGFHWGDSPNHVDQVLRAASVQVVLRERREAGADVWTVEGLVHPGLHRTIFVFQQAGLSEVELQYLYDRPLEWHQVRLREMHEYFDARYQPAGQKLDARISHGQRGTETRTGYQWHVGKNSVAVFYRSFTSPNNKTTSPREIIVWYTNNPTKFESSVR